MSKIFKEQRAKANIIVLHPEHHAEYYRKDSPVTLADLKHLLGDCYVELVPIEWRGKAAQMFIDEEGKLKNLPFNYEATVLYHVTLIAKGISVADYIAGSAVILLDNAQAE